MNKIRKLYKYGFHSQNFCTIFAKESANFFVRCTTFLREKIALCAIIRKLHFAQNCAFPHLRYSVLQILIKRFLAYNCNA